MQGRVGKDIPSCGECASATHSESDVSLPVGARWPAAQLERRPWFTNPDQRGINGNRPPRADRELTEIDVEIPGRIEGLALGLSDASSAKCEEATARITALDAKGALLTGIGGFLVRTEALASSKIERINVNLDDFARAAAGAKASDNAKSALNAVSAVREMVDRAGREGSVSLAAILDTHRRLLRDDMLEAEFAGHLRRQQNWVGGSDYSPRGAVHVPPPHDMVPDLMEDLTAFSGRRDISAVAQSLAAHAQFEAIHPFTDGNGRVGRALINGILRARRLTCSVSVPVAAAMLGDVDRYFDRLRDYRQGDLEGFVSYGAERAIEAAEAALISADVLSDLPGQWDDLIGGRRGSVTRRLAGGLLATPIVDSKSAASITGAVPTATLAAIDDLADLEVLREITGGERGRIWVCGPVMDEIAELQERIGARAKPSLRQSEPPLARAVGQFGGSRSPGDSDPPRW